MTELFITGTDTNCGKTFVTSLLIRYLRVRNINCIGLKPIASGCEYRDGKWVNEDIEQLMKANQSKDVINQWLFQPPIAPHFAAREEGVRITAKEVISFCRQPQFMNSEVRLIEGAGGLMVPLNEKETWIDVVKTENIPLLVVVGIRLGCINHILQLEEVIKSHGLNAVGWVANVLDVHVGRIEDNINAIKDRIELPLISTVQFKSNNININSMMRDYLIKSKKTCKML